MLALSTPESLRVLFPAWAMVCGQRPPFGGPWGAGFGPGALPAGAGGLWELSSAFCSSHQVATTLLSWPPALLGQFPWPGWGKARCAVILKGNCFFQLLLFFVLIWVIHNQNKHTEEKPNQTRGLVLSCCMQLACGGWLGPPSPVCSPPLWGRTLLGKGG